jgi:transcriptional regulator
MLYTPSHFAAEDRALAAAVVRDAPFATLLALGGAEPVVTHLPLLLDDAAQPWRLLGHVAQANPQWATWESDARAIAIFHGGDAYVSPALYTTRRAVPTWNYVVVHLHGRVALLHDAQAKERVLKALIDRHDAAYRGQWDELDLAYREGMKRGIVALEIEVDRVEAKFKLSQNRPAEDRARVHAAMAAGDARAQALAAWTARLAAPSAHDG